MPGVSERLSREICSFTQGLREVDLFKSPGMAETLDWANALIALGSNQLQDEVVQDTLGVILKYQEDVDRIRGDVSQRLVQRAVNAAAAAPAGKPSAG